MKSLFLALMLAAILDGSALAAQPNNNNNNNNPRNNNNNSNNNNGNNNVQVPETSTFILLGSGLLGLVIWFKKKRD